MKDNFFRKDLNLGGRWWHRLLFVMLIALFIYALCIVLNTPFPKYRTVESLQNRMSTELRLLTELISPNEKIGEYENILHGDWYEKNGGWVLRQPNVYCATNITQHIEKISDDTGVYSYKGSGPIELISIEDFKNYINNQRANCVYSTSIDILDNDIKVLSWAWFINDETKVWESSTLATMIYIAREVFLVVIAFFLMIILYYKVFLYVLFGRAKKSSQ